MMTSYKVVIQKDNCYVVMVALKDPLTNEPESDLRFPLAFPCTLEQAHQWVNEIVEGQKMPRFCAPSIAKYDWRMGPWSFFDACIYQVELWSTNVISARSGYKEDAGE